MMIITKSFLGKYSLKAKQVEPSELLMELVRAIDLICKEISRKQCRDQRELFSFVIEALDASSRVSELMPETKGGR